MPDDKIKISALPSALSLNNTDVFPVVQGMDGDNKVTSKAALTVLAAHILEVMQYNNLDTANKTIVDAINSVLDNLADEYDESLTYSVGDCVQHNGLLYQCNTAITTAEQWDPTHWTQIKAVDVGSGGGGGGLPSDVIAPDYDSSQTYEVGDYVMHEDQLYVCNTAITTAEAWTADHWTLTDVEAELKKKADALNTYTKAQTDALVNGLIDDAAAANNKTFSSNKIKSITDLKADKSELTTEIEGYQKFIYKDLTVLSTLTKNKYAEMQGGYVQISNSANYKYAVIDIVEGKTYNTTGVNVYDMRPMIFTNDAGQILFYLPTQRKTTAEYVTVVAVAPAGATKLYVNGRINDEIIIKEKGVFFELEGADNQGVNVEINKNETLDTIITTFRGGTVRQKLEVFNNTDQPNNAILPAAVEVFVDNAWKTIVNNEDDNCPVQLMSGYIGAGHGYAKARKITLTSHGKTYADIGSKWQLNSSTPHYWYIVRIIDNNNLVMLGENVSTNSYDTTSWTDGDTFTHVEGGTHTDLITGFSSESYLIAPLDKNHIKKVMLDGVEEVNNNGYYNAKTFVDIIEEYGIVNPQSIVPEILGNMPVGGYTENPEINTGNPFIHFSNIYRILNDGTMLLFSQLDNDAQISLSYWGGTQYAQKASATVFGGGLYRYVPKLLEVDGHDLRIPFNMSNWNFSIDATKTYWEEADNPPDRLIHLYTDNSNIYKAGYSVGYLPVAYGKAENRKNNIGNAMTLYSTKKAYPHLVDRVGLNYNDWSSFTPFQCVAFRKPVLDVANVHTDAYFIPYGEKCYLYADYHAISDDRIKVPSEYVGKPITIIEKSSNVTVYGTVATDEIRIRVSTASPMYGYAVIQIG